MYQLPAQPFVGVPVSLVDDATTDPTVYSPKSSLAIKPWASASGHRRRHRDCQNQNPREFVPLTDAGPQKEDGPGLSRSLPRTPRNAKRELPRVIVHLNFSYGIIALLCPPPKKRLHTIRGNSGGTLGEAEALRVEWPSKPHKGRVRPREICGIRTAGTRQGLPPSICWVSRQRTRAETATAVYFLHWPWQQLRPLVPLRPFGKLHRLPCPPP